MRRQRTVIIGAGSLGRSLASALAREGQEVTVIDSDAVRLDGLEGVGDLRPLVGSATSLRVLRQAGVAEADVVVALTGEDSANALVCGLAKRLGARTCIARVRDAELAASAQAVGLERIGIDQVISPEGLAVDALARIALSPGCVDAMDLAEGHIVLRALVVAADAPLAGRSIAEARQQLPGTWLVAALGDADGWTVPGPQDRLLAGEPAYVCAADDDIARLVPAFDPHATAPRRALIVGAGDIGQPLAAQLDRAGLRVQLLEADPARAEQAALELAAADAGVEVLRGTIADADLAHRLGLSDCDLLIAASAQDQDNLMAALLARARGVRRILAVAHHAPTVKLMGSLDIDAVVCPRRLAASAIQRAVRGKAVAHLARLSDEHLEILELTVAAG
ncbi:MAG: NAD-binding protein, partial [Planctomycetota bacterium]|nr:NAD-binding protein [Planctomycetota bacterium]